MFKKLKTISLVIISLTILSLIGARGASADNTLPNNFTCGGLSSIYNGVDYKKGTSTNPRPITWYIVKADLDDPNVDLMVTPERDLGTTTSTFLSDHGASVAINGDGHNQSTFYPTGLAASTGNIYSPKNNQPSIYITPENQVSFSGTSTVWDAISGFHTIVRGSQITEKIDTCQDNNPVYCSDKHPRTSVGINNRNELIFIVVDGRQPGVSEGVTLKELALMMRECNATNAINMDGGGSSTLVSSNQGVLNNPSDGPERVVGNHFGVCVGGCANEGGGIGQGFYSRLRHDQIAACTYGLTLSLGILGKREVLGIPGPCKLGTLKDFLVDFFDFRFKHRLTNWIDRKPPHEEDYTSSEFIREYKEWRGQTCIGPFNIVAEIDFEVFGLNITFEKIIELFPWFGLLAENEWHLCFDNPLNFNYWSNLFPYIPFSSTEDRLGEVAIKNYRFTNSNSGNFRIVYSELIDPQPADLFFPHMEEGVGLADWLQQTYAPKYADLEDITDSGYVPRNLYCDMTQIRSNPGDDLFPGDISATLNYTAQVGCQFAYYDPFLPGNLCKNLAGGTCEPVSIFNPTWHWFETDYGVMDCDYPNQGLYHCVSSTEYYLDPAPSPNLCESLAGSTGDYKCYPDTWETTCAESYPDPVLCGDDPDYICGYDCNPPLTEAPTTQACTQPVYVNLPLETKTPLADTVWAKLVAGSAGVFRRIFPRVGEGGAVQQIWDLPAATGVRYLSPDGGITLAGNPDSLKSGADAEIYFPHIGGVKEYFLEGIQTALRPKGFGYNILSDEPSGPGIPVGGECKGEAFSKLAGTLPTLSSKGEQEASTALSKLTEDVINAYKAAELVTGVPCEILAGIHFIEANNDPNRNLQWGGPLTGTLTESAIQAGNELKNKVGGTIPDIDTAIKALSRYNGGGNSNCQASFDCPYTPTSGRCGYTTACANNSDFCYCTANPDPSSCRVRCSGISSAFPWVINYNHCPRKDEGYDDIYVANWLSSPENDVMYLLYKYDCTQTLPAVFQRPGSFTVALTYYLSHQ
ncbi:MAG: phosphodiester glycosidase family protein [Candidatus Woesebacteria bacterium]|jgi:hypothetical protein